MEESKTTKIFIDELSEHTARVLVGEEQKEFFIARDFLPECAKEGMMITAVFSVLEEDKRDLKKEKDEIQKLLDELISRNG